MKRFIRFVHFHSKEPTGFNDSFQSMKAIMWQETVKAGYYHRLRYIKRKRV